jgi:hypothetical protein
MPAAKGVETMSKMEHEARSQFLERVHRERLGQRQQQGSICYFSPEQLKRELLESEERRDQAREAKLRFIEESKRAKLIKDQLDAARNSKKNEAAMEILYRKALLKMEEEKAVEENYYKLAEIQMNSAEQRIEDECMGQYDPPIGI